MDDKNIMSPRHLDPVSPMGFDGPSLMVKLFFYHRHNAHPKYQSLVSMTTHDDTQQHQASSSTRTISTRSVTVHHNTSDLPFIQHPYLNSLNLAVNAEFHFLVCQVCKEAIVTSTTRAHIVNKHPELVSVFQQRQFDDMVNELQLASSLPINITGPRSVVHGLAVCDALACNHCPMVMTKAKNMREHHVRQHEDAPIPQKWRTCKAQRMKTEGAGSQRTFWEIVVPTTIAMDSVVEQLMNEMEEQLENIQVPMDHRFITPWLHTTRWHEYVAGSGFSIDWLRQSIALPQPKEVNCLKNLHNIMGCYFQQALELIETSDELVLQRINSPDPVKK